MLSLLRADLLKISKHPMGWAMLIFCAMLVSVLLRHIRTQSQEETSFSNSIFVFNFPGGLLIGPQLIEETTGLLLVVVFSANLIGIEYSHDTWKNLLTRRPYRPPFIVSKWLTLAISIVIAVTVLALWAQYNAIALGLADTITDVPPLSRVLMELVVRALYLLAAGSMALLGAVLWRSSGFGVIVGLLWYAVDIGLLPGRLDDPFKGYILSVSKKDLLAHITGASTDYLASQDLLVMALYLFLPLLLAALLFRQRDLS